MRTSGTVLVVCAIAVLLYLGSTVTATSTTAAGTTETTTGSATDTTTGSATDTTTAVSATDTTTGSATDTTTGSGADTTAGSATDTTTGSATDTTTGSATDTTTAVSATDTTTGSATDTTTGSATGTTTAVSATDTTGSATDTTTGSASDTTTGSATDTTTAVSATDTTTGSATDTTTGSATDTTAVSATDTTTGSATDTSTGSATDTSTGGASDTTSGSATDTTTAVSATDSTATDTTSGSATDTTAGGATTATDSTVQTDTTTGSATDTTTVGTTNTSTGSATGTTDSTVEISNTTVGTTSSTNDTIGDTTAATNTSADTSSAVVTTAVPPTTPTTTTTTTTTRKTTTRYPTEDPDLDNAVFGFNFTVTVLRSANFSGIWISIRIDIEQEFIKSVPGFQSGSVHLLDQTRRKRDEPAVTEHRVGVNVSAKDVQESSFTSNLTGAMENLNSTLAAQNISLDDYSGAIANFAAMVGDACNAVGVSCQDYVDHVCRDGRCRHRCEYYNCGGYGVCYIHADPDTGTRDTRCKCASDEVFDYRGDQCDEAVMKEKYIAAIAGSVGGLLLIIMVVLVICFCRTRRRLHKDKSYTDAYDPSPCDRKTDGYRGLDTAKKYNPTYDNEAYQPDMTPFYRGTSEGQAHYDYIPDDCPMDEPRPVMTPYFASSNLPVREQFSIQRPSLLVRPKTET